MKKKWHVSPLPEENEIERLAKELGCNRITAILLLQRGIVSKEEADRFFHPSLDMLHDPFLMKDMDKAVSRLDKAIDGNEKIFIYGDYDVDGTTSVALLYKYLKDKTVPGRVEYYIPDRYIEGYGISENSLNYASENGFSLMLVTDYGVKDVERIEYARSKGIDIIICDHHTPGEELPKAVAVLDPQRADCNYPYKWLSACGVSFKLIQAHSIRNNLPPEDIYPLLDLVCVSIAGDIVPIMGENRILTYFGLRRLNTAPSLGLKIIMKSARIEGEIGINDIVFKIGPRINAAGRVDDGNKSVALLTSENEKAAAETNDDINTYNDKRRKIDHATTEEAVEFLRISENESRKRTIVLFNPRWHKGVIAIVASRLAESFHKPTVILTESNGLATGSARSIEGFDLYAAISKCSELLENYGGHKYAAGLTLKIENIPAFRKKFEAAVEDMMEKDMLIPQMHIDAKIALTDVTTDLCRELNKFAPFGPCNHIPVFMTEKVSNFVIGTKRVGRRKEHLKLVVEDGTRACNERNGIGFGMGKLYDKLYSGNYFDIAYSIQENRFMGKTDVQMLIRDIIFPDDKTENP